MSKFFQNICKQTKLGRWNTMVKPAALQHCFVSHNKHVDISIWLQSSAVRDSCVAADFILFTQKDSFQSTGSYAEAVANNGYPQNKCIPGKQAVAEKIQEIMSK